MVLTSEMLESETVLFLTWLCWLLTVQDCKKREPAFLIMISLPVFWYTGITYFKRAIRPEVTLSGWRDVNLIEVTNWDWSRKQITGIMKYAQGGNISGAYAAQRWDTRRVLQPSRRQRRARKCIECEVMGEPRRWTDLFFFLTAGFMVKVSLCVVLFRCPGTEIWCI